MTTIFMSVEDLTETTEIETTSGDVGIPTMVAASLSSS